MVHFGETITKLLQQRFPNAKVECMNGYWNVTIDAGIGTIVESYKLKNGKLIRFATIEMED